MAIIIGDGAFRIWVGKDRVSKWSNNIGIRIRKEKFPTGVDLEETIQQLVSEIEKLIRNRCPWCE